jgi:hypothetical protein
VSHAITVLSAEAENSRLGCKQVSSTSEERNHVNGGGQKSKQKQHALSISAPVDLLDGVLVTIEDMVVGAFLLDLPQDYDRRTTVQGDGQLMALRKGNGWHEREGRHRTLKGAQQHRAKGQRPQEVAYVQILLSKPAEARDLPEGSNLQVYTSAWWPSSTTMGAMRLDVRGTPCAALPDTA